MYEQSVKLIATSTRFGWRVVARLTQSSKKRAAKALAALGLDSVPEQGGDVGTAETLHFADAGR